MAGTIVTNSVQPDVGTNLYLDATQGSGNVIIGNTTTSLVSISPTGNITSRGTITANGISSASGNLSVVGAVSATGNVSGSNVSSSGNISANNITSSYDITASSFNGGPLGGMRNRIINGDMRIDQRNAGANVTPGSGITYTLDRWAYQSSQASKFTIQQTPSTTESGYTNRLSAGFANYLSANVVSSVSVSSGDYFMLWQAIEGYNYTDWGWGTSNAKSITLSFLVYSSLTGSFGGSIQNGASTRSYPFSYSISSANTWTPITITIPGDSDSSWLTVTKTNGAAILVNFGLGIGSTYAGTAGSWVTANRIVPTGSVNVVGTNGATFYITGVQLEKSSVATPFENRLYGTELALCQRYCYVQTNDSQAYRWFAQGYNTSTTGASMGVPLPQVMRSSPSITWTDITKFIVDQPTTGGQACTSMSASFISPYYARYFPVVASGLTANWPVAFASNGDSLLRSVTYSAEL